MTAEPVFDLLTVSRRDFERRLCAVMEGDWARSTPCSEWDVRLLVNHVVSQEFRVARLISGGTFEEYVETRDDDFLGPEPLAAWRAGCRRCDDAIGPAGDLGRMIVYGLGPMPIRELLRVRVMDMTVHTWDLSDAIGFDLLLEEGTAQAALETPGTVGAPGATISSDAAFTRSLIHEIIDM